MVRPFTLFVLFVGSFVLNASGQLILIGRDQEIAIGREVAKRIEEEYGVWDDPEQTRRIERIGYSLVAVCDRKGMPYTFKILAEDKILNAVAAPGGFIYITKALLDALESDDEVAFVLGHEIGHICGDHIRKRLSQAIAGSLLLSALFGGTSELVQIGVDLMFTLYQRGYNRNQERDADTRAVRYMKAAGYDPIAALTALKKLGMRRYRGIMKWFATHPDVPSRVQRLAKMLDVDPQTLQPLPPNASLSLKGLPRRSITLLFAVRESLYRLGPKDREPKRLWRLKGRIVEGVQASPDGRRVWLLIRKKGSPIVHLVTTGVRRQRTRFLASFYADTIMTFSRSPDGQWLVVVAREGRRQFAKLFRGDGKEVTIGGRTPLGDVFNATWLADNRLILVSRRFGETMLISGRPGGVARFFPLPQAPSPIEGIAASRERLWLLAGGGLYPLRDEGREISGGAILKEVSFVAIRKDHWAIVQDGKLRVGVWKDGRWDGQEVDNRRGVIDGLLFSEDGKWLAYRYRFKSEDTFQLWLVHLPSRRLWRVALNATAFTLAP